VSALAIYQQLKISNAPVWAITSRLRTIKDIINACKRKHIEA
jgi:hypothetical protein